MIVKMDLDDESEGEIRREPLYKHLLQVSVSLTTVLRIVLELHSCSFTSLVKLPLVHTQNRNSVHAGRGSGAAAR